METPTPTPSTTPTKRARPQPPTTEVDVAPIVTHQPQGDAPQDPTPSAEPAFQRNTKVKLRKSILFGEKNVEDIDLSGLLSLTGADVLFCRKEAQRKSGEPVFYGLADDAYRLEVLAKVTGLAPELFLKLSAPDYEEVDQTVKLFLSGSV